MAVKNNPIAARMVRELKGVKLVNVDQVDILHEEEEVAVGHRYSSNGPYTREGGTPGSESRLKSELPPWKALWRARPNCLKTLDCQNHGDRHLLETVANVATSMPFIALGLQTPRKNAAARLYADSLVGVGVASSLYHVSRGEARKVFRFGDYAMIALASLCLNGATKDNPKALMLASALLIPVQPMLVTVLHTGIMEATFIRRVSKEPKLRTAHSLHKLSSVIGSALFVVDDIMPQIPYVHAAWHLAAVLGVATCSKLLD